VLLAMDTATPAITVALAEGDRVLAESTVLDPRRHGELLAPAIAQVLATAGVDRTALRTVAVGVGPGPFTGLRVGLVTARMLGAALGIPVVGVCTLDALGYASGQAGRYRVATDARRREVYWAAYDGLVRVDGPHVGPAADVTGEGPVVGAGALLYPDVLGPGVEPEHPSAVALARWVAAGRPTLPPDPLYLRRPDAAPPGPRKSVLGSPAS
jgi:tRNA threonylcarbamoyl adenosine modification protein YeaZ